MPSQEQIGQFLSSLEAEEAKFLSWGYVDGGFTEQEVYQRAEQWIDQHAPGLKPNELVDALYEQRLLLELPYQYQPVWRTRMAETVRLLMRLRQMFPKPNQKSWKEARTLVSDFRFTLRERRYPKRDLPKHQVLSEIKQHATELELGAIDALLPDHFQLSRFQLQAAMQMLHDREVGNSRGMIVCAGTGTGKSISFYLPALSRIVDIAVNKLGFWTKGLALYPRNELLKDQFMETYQQARRLDAWLLNKAGRKLKIGAFFGPTPESADKIAEKKWDEEHGGSVCPYMRCPAELKNGQTCNSLLVWKKQDIVEGIERLTCVNGNCGHVVTGDEVALTRKSMRNEPPDLLFTTTEMMNRSLSDLKSRHVFGVGVTHPPEIMLLDEVHTYSGVHGAQVALLLRRWRHALQSNVHFTGLSATLKEAGHFFAELTGLPRGHVAEVAADEQPDEMVSEGQEYQLILRGDPVSGTSLLSTTIQTAMLMRRMLDLPNQRPSNGAVGERVFVFTDDLDVTNRLYHSLLDAEAWKNEKQINPRKQPLAMLRQHERDDAPQRLAQGQSWWFAQEIGHQLENRLVMGRTSSQDAGVRTGADLIVATASLEVGYNDPNVGAVIQHKAPMDMASFLQRKGRAGRKRGMRPWTVTVLTDFGRDRMLYQGYEMLFDPVFERRRLPIRNRYVLKMQAVFCLMDWIAEELSGKVPPGSLWNDFSAPSMYAGGAERQKQAARVVRKLIIDKLYRRHLENYMQKALAITEDELAAVLWESPRAVVLNVLPTLLRRLESGWLRYVPKELLPQPSRKEAHKFGEPLQEFIPSNLFSDLNLPEIRIVLPPMKGRSEDEHPYMPIGSAMKLLAPGRVTRRFGYRWSNESHWVAPPHLQPSVEPQPLVVTQFCRSFEDLGNFQMMQGDDVLTIPCLRPYEFVVERTGPQIKVTSNAQLVWKSQLFPTRPSHAEGSALLAEAPYGSKWRSIIMDIRFYTHNLRSEVTVRRFALGSDATVKVKPNVTVEMPLRYSDEQGQAVALGFEQQVDGICFRYQLPEKLRSFRLHVTDELLRSTRALYFRHLVMHDSRLNGQVNVFQRERLTETYLSALSSQAMASQQSLEDIWCEWQQANERFTLGMNDVFNVIFQALPDSQSDDAEYDEEEEEQKLQVVHRELLDLCHDLQVANVLHDLASVLWAEPDEAWNRWMQERWKYTLGSALLQACQSVTPEVQNDDLILDIGGGPRPPESEGVPDGVEEIWITETAIGGGGVVEEIVRRFYEDPRRFFRLVESALGPSDLELIDSEMTRLLHLADQQQDIRTSMQEIRVASGYGAVESAMTELQERLRENGVLMTHGVLSSLYNRLLKPGSSAHTDELMNQLIDIWKKEELRLGVELDARVFAYVFSADCGMTNRFARTFTHIDPATVHDPHWRFQVIYSFLWPRGQQIRSKSLENYNPFVKTVPGDREILLLTLREEAHVDFGAPNWQEQVAAHLSSKGIVHLTSQIDRLQELRQSVLGLAVQPIDGGFVHVYPRVEGVRRESGRVIVTLDIREVVR